MIHNWSKDSDYHTQRNNAIIPHSSCNTTAMVMALKQAGHELPFPADIQPEDYLSRYLQSKKAYEKMRELAPWAFDTSTGGALYLPQEVHAVLRWAVNTLLGAPVDVFDTERGPEDLCSKLWNGYGAVLSGVFPVAGGHEIHHMVSLAGFYDDMSAFLIDDPYGDYRSGYRDHHGNNVVVPQNEFMRIIKEQNSRDKWAHLIAPA